MTTIIIRVSGGVVQSVESEDLIRYLIVDEDKIEAGDPRPDEEDFSQYSSNNPWDNILFNKIEFRGNDYYWSDQLDNFYLKCGGPNGGKLAFWKAEIGFGGKTVTEEDVKVILEKIFK